MRKSLKVHNFLRNFIIWYILSQDYEEYIDRYKYQDNFLS